MQIKKITTISVLVSLLAILGVWSIQIGPLRFSLMLFSVALFSLLFNWKIALSSFLIYYALISLGLPIGTGFRGGIGFFINPWLGYFIGYLFFPLIILLGKKTTKQNYWLFIYSIVASAIVYILGVWGLFFYGQFWGQVQYQDLSYLITIGVTPFIIVDIIKIIVAYLIYISLKNNPFIINLEY